MSTKRVPVIDRTGPEPREVGWAEVDEEGKIIGVPHIDDSRVYQTRTDMQFFSLAPDPGTSENRT